MTLLDNIYQDAGPVTFDDSLQIWLNGVNPTANQSAINLSETLPPERGRDRSSTWASYFISVIVHLNVLLLLALTYRALQTEQPPEVMLDTTFIPGEQQDKANAQDVPNDVVQPQQVVFADKAPLNAEEMLRADSDSNLPGLKALSGGMGVGGLDLGGGVGFFGTKAQGRTFVFVVDCSGSMQGTRFRRATSELRKTLQQLEPFQSFQLVFFNERAIPFIHSQFKTELLPATPEVLRETFQWIARSEANGGTIPNDALSRALALRADVVFFLTDAEQVPRSVRTLIANENKHRATIHTIAFGHRGGETLMQGIASDHHGRYRYVP